jgi:hypothetical protein
MRRKFIIILAAFAALVSCNKSGLDISSGNVVGEMNVTAASGRITVSVETVGRWIVYEADNADWVEFDVKGGVGKGAFTVSYDSNMSSVVDLRSARKARIVVTSEDFAKSDTLNIIQQGFDNSIRPSAVVPCKEIVLEWEQVDAKELTFVYCSADGVEGGAKELGPWAMNFDIVACGNSFIKPAVSAVSDNKYAVYVFEDMNFVSADLKDAWAAGREAGLEAFTGMVEDTYNAYNSPSKWIIGGQMYHYSMMQSSYPATPSWYPTDVEDPDFDADRYAWNNNLYDCLWMSERNFVQTWTDQADGKSYMADYVYVSRDVLASIYSVERLDKVLGMEHNPIKITLKY